MARNNWMKALTLLIAFTLMAACGTDGNNERAPITNDRQINPYDMNRTTGQDARNNDLMIRDRQDLPPGNARDGNRMFRGDHNNSRLEFDQQTADRVAAMNEVDSALVFLTERSAYVAVVLQDHGKHNDGLGNIRSNRYGNDRQDNGLTGSELEWGGYGMNEDVTSRLKDRISNEVIRMNQDIRQVYVSANPDFVERMNGFVEQMANGRPVQGFMHEFNAMAERMFPTQRQGQPQQIGN